MKRRKLFLSCFAVIAIAVLVITAVGGVWYIRRLRPQPAHEKLFQGVEYIRDIRSSPRRIVIHVIKIDLREEGMRVFVTPGDPEQELPLKARTTSLFLKNFDLQVAINGDGFTPWHDYGIFDYYPKNGERVDAIGFAASEGLVYSQDTDGEPRIYFSSNKTARINAATGKNFNVISGNQNLVHRGNPVAGLEGDPNPRTAVALDQGNRFLILVVVDGRQPGYSEGVTLQELAEIIIYHGGYTAINLDGGGSSTMVVEGPLGGAKVLNSPIHVRIPGRERPVGNHLGIYAKPLK